MEALSAKSVLCSEESAQPGCSGGAFLGAKDQCDRNQWINVKLRHVTVISTHIRAVFPQSAKAFAQVCQKSLIGNFLSSEALPRQACEASY